VSKNKILEGVELSSNYTNLECSNIINVVQKPFVSSVQRLNNKIITTLIFKRREWNIKNVKNSKTGTEGMAQLNPKP
jgi:hypothetical protein